MERVDSAIVAEDVNLTIVQDLGAFHFIALYIVHACTRIRIIRNDRFRSCGVLRRIDCVSGCCNYFRTPAAECVGIFGICCTYRCYALEALNIDTFGLDQIDNKLLLTIIDKFRGGPVGLNTIATAMGEDAGTIEDVYEPYLIKEGFIKRTPRGREATPLAYQHLGKTPLSPDGQQSMF